MTEIGLAAALEELRQELYEAQDRSAGEQFGFVVNEAQLELLLELRNTGKADGKLTFGVAAVGAAGEHATVRTHKLTLKLAIRDRAAGDANPEISHNDTRAWTEG
ncbi:trypco2 family protein [Kitasatospora fiedleri]|uniref:trypco2 family protein n=1 Tax=Kitasatospora fiedleri TaxID=2991545 RepID=UPI00249C0CC9|nr:trypco2 family protein [Kitasatospora fiedleri]